MVTEPLKAWQVIAYIAMAALATLFFVRVFDDPANATCTAPSQPVAEISYLGEEGKTALELLKEHHVPKTVPFRGVGDEMVTCINGIAPPEQYFWAFYVNGEFAPTGAGQYETLEGDVITWKLEKILP
jgi:hypothetical protein